MGLVSGAKDGAILGLGVVIAWWIIKRPPFAIFGQSEYYPEIDGEQMDPDTFDPNIIVQQGSNNIEAKAVKILMNKYCHLMNYNFQTGLYESVECCPTLESFHNQGSGGYFLKDVLLPETDYFSEEDSTTLFNRYKVFAVTYAQLVNAIKGLDIDGNPIIYGDGSKAKDNRNSWLRDC